MVQTKISVLNKLILLHGVEKRIIMVGLRPPSLESAACKVGPQLVFGNLDFSTTIPRKGKSDSLCLNCLCKHNIQNTCFPSGSLEF